MVGHGARMADLGADAPDCGGTGSTAAGASKENKAIENGKAGGDKVPSSGGDVSTAAGATGPLRAALCDGAVTGFSPGTVAVTGSSNGRPTEQNVKECDKGPGSGGDVSAAAVAADTP